MKTKEELLAIEPVQMLRYILVASYMDMGNGSVDEFDPEDEDYDYIMDDNLHESYDELLAYPESEIGLKGLALRAKVVHSLGGGEGDGENVERVVAILDEKDKALFYLRTTGFYESYSGIDWSDEWEQVEPYEVTVTKYKKKKVKKND